MQITKKHNINKSRSACMLATKFNSYILTVINRLNSPSGMVRKTRRATIVMTDISALKQKDSQ